MITTYGAVAKALGDPIAARFVGLAMSLNENVIQVPCRRVVRSDGKLGGYTSHRGVDEKIELLRSEGIRICNGRVVDMEPLLFDDFRSSMPLRRLRERQLALRKQVLIPTSDRQFDRVAGMDVSYDGNRAYASVVVAEAESGRVLESEVVESEAAFPYIPTYLAYRELPIISPLAEFLVEGTVLVYDGNGLLHPERFGIASHAGLAFNVPTIGVAKRLLCGSVRCDASAEVELDGDVLGYALSNRGGAPIFVSPGHGVSARQALSIIRKVTKHRIPEPIRQAHKRANEARRSAINK